MDGVTQARKKSEGMSRVEAAETTSELVFGVAGTFATVDLVRGA